MQFYQISLKHLRSQISVHMAQNAGSKTQKPCFFQDFASFKNGSVDPRIDFAKKERSAFPKKSRLTKPRFRGMRPILTVVKRKTVKPSNGHCLTIDTVRSGKNWRFKRQTKISTVWRSEKRQTKPVFVWRFSFLSNRQTVSTRFRNMATISSLVWLWCLFQWYFDWYWSNTKFSKI